MGSFYLFINGVLCDVSCLLPLLYVGHMRDPQSRRKDGGLPHKQRIISGMLQSKPLLTFNTRVLDYGLSAVLQPLVTMAWIMSEHRRNVLTCLE